LVTASLLFERACEWGEAAAAALLAGESERALLLAALGDHEHTAEAALSDLVAHRAKADVMRVADLLRQRGQLSWAARAYEEAGAQQTAAEAWERAGNRVRAARLLEALSDGQGAIGAARVLEAGLRREPERADLLLALGSLLLRCGKAAAALRAFQRVPEDSPEHVLALQLSVSALTGLGMSDGRAEVVGRLAKLGQPVLPEGATSADDGHTYTQVPPLPAEAARVALRLYGRYEVLREVSSTATARLVECNDVLRGERVAVKLFSAQAEATRGSGRDALAHFLREARVLARLAHPNIVPLYEIVEQGPALVLEWMPGGTLEEHLAEESFTPARAVDIACAVLGALGEAHRLGVVHRDLKPANILFDAGGTARLSDFGVAHLGDLAVTATVGTFGSLAYMSPEQRQGRPATAQSDLFGVGVVLYEMLTGARPRAQIQGSALDPPLSTVHRYLDGRHDALLLSLLAEDPDSRPRDAWSAQKSLLALPWPREHDAHRPPLPHVAPASVHPAPMRFESLGALAGYDHWLERHVTVVPLTPRGLERARTFARAAHSAIEPVLRIDRESGTVWLGARSPLPLARPLSRTELALLESALASLHEAGFVHGAIDPTTITADGGVPALLFPLQESSSLVATADDDRAALARLALP
jgi:tetratricopeptide (TPR) repeat protein